MAHYSQKTKERQERNGIGTEPVFLQCLYKRRLVQNPRSINRECETRHAPNPSQQVGCAEENQLPTNRFCFRSRQDKTTALKGL